MGFSNREEGGQVWIGRYDLSKRSRSQVMRPEKQPIKRKHRLSKGSGSQLMTSNITDNMKIQLFKKIDITSDVNSKTTVKKRHILLKRSRTQVF